MKTGESNYDETPQECDTKECPFCAERVSSKAKKCRYCGETLDVVLRVAEESKRSSSGNVYMNAATSYQQVRRSFPHLLHLFLTLITGGVWVVIWILHYLLRNRSYYS